MILTCPECSTRYLTKDEAIGVNGRTVRCSNCETSWFVAADADSLTLKDHEADALAEMSFAADPVIKESDIQTPPAPSSTIEPATTVPSRGVHADIRDRTDQRRRRQRLWGVGMIWGVVLTLLVIGAVLAYIFRQDIVNTRPETATLYKAFGIEVTQTGLTLSQPTPESLLIDGKPILVINGTIRNISARRVEIPLIRLALQSGDGADIAEWFVEPQQAVLDAGKSLDYVSQYPTPPLDGTRLTYAFANERS